MSTYTKTTNFTAKDNLTSGDPAKVIKGSEFDTEFNSIETAVNSKANSNNGTHTGTTTISTANIDTLQVDGVEVTATPVELNTLDGITSTTAELNKLDGFLGDYNDLNYAKDLRATGVTSAEFDTLDGITATTAELNTLDGITSTTAELNILDGVTSTTAEINKLDGFTGSVDDLNYAKDLRATGVTTAELDVLDGITASTAELNITDGLTATTAELNTLDGITATTTELNYTDGVTSNIQTQLNGKATSAQGALADSAVQPNDDVTLGTVSADGLTITSTGNINATNAEIGTLNFYNTDSSGAGANNSAFVRAVTNTASGAGGQLVFATSVGTESEGVDATENMRLDSLGNLSVEGTVTADGLTVDGVVNITSAVDSQLTLGYNASNSTSYGYYQIINNNTGNPLEFHTGGSKTLNLGSNGNVEFYEDTGTTAKMVWSSSAESLGIGSNASTIAGVNTRKDADSDVIGVYISNESTGASASSTYWNDAQGNNFYITTYGDGHARSNETWLGSTAGSSEIVFSPNNTERMRIDSAGNVGIANSSPVTRLDIDGFITLRNSAYPSPTTSVYKDGFIGSNDGTLTYAVNGASNGAYGSHKFQVRKGDSSDAIDAMSIDSAGRLGIGTTSPSAPLTIQSSSGASSINLIGRASDGYSTIAFRNNADNATLAAFFADDSSDALQVHVAGSEKARIDSSGNLLVGTTDNNVYNDVTGTGTVIQSNGIVQLAASNGTPLYLNRQSTDGTIAEFRKDGSTVGSIGTTGGALDIKNAVAGGVAVSYENSTNGLLVPIDTTGAFADGLHNLGRSNARFKDLYLSGGVYLGGTGAANKLDDYEEGIFTPNDNNITYTSPIGRYERVGRTVHVRGFFVVPANTNGNDADISLPFAYNEAASHYITCVVETTDGSVDIKGRFDGLGAGSSYIHIVTPAEARVSLATLSGKSIRFRATYTTTA